MSIDFGIIKKKLMAIKMLYPDKVIANKNGH